MTFLHRSAKKIVSALPIWLLRFRPFSVYAILPTNAVRQPDGMSFPRGEVRQKLKCQIRWVTNAAEAVMLRPVATNQNIATLNFTTRRAAAAWLEGEVIGCVWIASDFFEDSDLGLRFELQPTDVWLFAAMVDSTRRNQGVYGQLLEFLNAELIGNNVRRILLGVAVGNESSRRAHARHGATKLGDVLAFRSLGLTLCFRWGGVRRLTPSAFKWREPVRLAVNL